MRVLGAGHADHFPITLGGAGFAIWVGENSFSRRHTIHFAAEQITCGNAVFLQNGRRYLVNPGDVYLLQAGSDNFYETGPAGMLHKRYVGFDGPALTTVFRSLGLVGRDVIRPGDPGAVTALMREAYALLDHQDAASLRRLSLAAYELLVLLSADLPPAYPSPLAAALSYMELHMGRRIAIAEIAEYAGIDAMSLHREFKAHFGLSPLQYLIGQRLALAQRLLGATDRPIKDIAATVGYGDQLHFSAQFKKHLGVSPQAFRSGVTEEGRHALTAHHKSDARPPVS